MHTHDDAMLYVGWHQIPRERFSVLNVMPTLLDLMEVEHPAGLDGESLL
jgi:bisphosphoglycerate-independent phosphoglycerate mutase (AlkP superfamily)